MLVDHVAVGRPQHDGNRPALARLGRVVGEADRASATPDSVEVTVTSGWPPWKIQESMIRRTGSPVASSSASHRSVVSVLP